MVQRSLRAELGLDASEVFSEFDEAPLGAASIGQVHRAVLAPKYGGREVVVKVQAPGIERRFRADITVQSCICFGAINPSLSSSRDALSVFGFC
jgi:predicted unusual protein kinase regulating ubiquinone biosynthesis (AarF/ABC1/UbiB family)